MQSQEHNKLLGIAHLVYGGLHLLLLLGAFLFFAVVLGSLPRHNDGPLPLPFFLFMGTFLFIYTLVLTIPAFVAGYALLKHKPWARTASIVAAVFEAMNVPLGTAVCIYSFWFMFSDAGRQFYDRQAVGGALPHSLPEPAAQQTWWQAETAAAQREREPVRPSPPDWRGQ